MCLLLESIKISDNKPQNLQWHQQRLDTSQREVFGEASSSIHLERILVTSELDPSVIYKARVVYGEALDEVEIEPYLVRPIKSIKIIEATELSYTHKYLNRTEINQLFAEKGEADDILLTKNGFLTDCSYSNICLWDGSHWYTPLQPLLAGTKRAQLLSNGAIFEREIHIRDINSYQYMTIINAMLDPGVIVVPISQLAD